MKKTIMTLLICLAIPVLGYMYLIYVYEPDPLTQKYIDAEEPTAKLKLLEKMMRRGESERWSWIDSAAELSLVVSESGCRKSRMAKDQNYVIADANKMS